MDCTGVLQSVNRDWSTDKLIMTFIINEDVSHESIEEIRSCEKLSLVANKWRQRWSLDANAYYWALLGKLAAVLKISNNYCHNFLLRRYGVFEEFDGKPVYIVIPDTEEAEKKADESETYHIKPTSNVREGNDGNMYRTYILLKGSHAYDTAEMSRLISGIRDECQQCGVPYETPDEIAQLLSLTGGK